MITTINDWKIYESINYQPNDIVDLKNYNFTELFNLVNKECFNSSLTIIPFELCTSKSFTASFNYTINRATKETYNKRFKFSTLFKITFQKLKNIMAHEMIHYYLNATGDRDKSHHGYSFKRQMYRINDLGLGYNVTLKDDEPGELNDDILNKKQAEKIFITFDSGSKRGYAILPEIAFDKTDLERRAKWNNLKNVNVYRTTSPHIKPIPASRKLKLAIINKTHEHLLDNVFNDTENTKFLYEL